MKKIIAILGSTGSIGKSTLQIVKKINQFKIKLLVTHKNYPEIIKQIKIFRPEIVVIINEEAYIKVKNKCPKVILFNKK